MTKNKQGAFLVAKEWAGHIFSFGKTGRAHFGQQKNEQMLRPPKNA